MMKNIVVFEEGHKLAAIIDVEGKDFIFRQVDAAHKNRLHDLLEGSKKRGFTYLKDVYSTGQHNASVVEEKASDEMIPYALEQSLVQAGFNAHLIPEVKADLFEFFDKEIKDMSIKEPSFVDIMQMGEQDALRFATELVGILKNPEA
jgi:hypothetical protein